MLLPILLLAVSTARAGVHEDLDRLRDGTWNQRIHATHDLGDQDAAGLPGLRLAAEDADWQVRMTAVHLMGQAGAAAVPDLARVLKNEPCRHVRLTALHWLGAIGGPAAEDAIREGLGDESGMVRLMGRYWLDKAQGRAQGADLDAGAAAEEDLKYCESSDGPGRVAWAAEEAKPAPEAAAPKPAEPAELDEPVVTRDPTRRAKPAPETLPGAAKLPERPASSKASAAYEPATRARLRELDALLAGAPDPRPAETMPPGKPGFQRGEIKTSGASYMADAGTGKSAADPVPALLKLLADRDPAKRARAADELGKRRAVPALPALTAALKDRVPRVRASCALALGNLGPSADPSVPALVKALKRGPEEVEWSAAVALGRIGTPRARKAFLRYSRQSAGAMLRDAVREQRNGEH